MPISQLRIYTIPESKWEAYFDRWDSTARPLMEHHGFRLVDTWTGHVDPVHATPSTRLTRALLAARRPWAPAATRATFEFVYRLEWNDEAHMKNAWQAFLTDRAWTAAKAASRKSAQGEPVLLVTDRVLTARP